MPSSRADRLARLEARFGPKPLEALTDAELDALAAEGIGPLLSCLTDEELRTLAAAPETASLPALLSHRPHPSRWPEWEDWTEETRAAVLEEWGPEGAHA